MEEKCHHSSTDLNTNDTTLMAESKEKLKSFLMRVKEENEKACSKLNVKKKNHYGIQRSIASMASICHQEMENRKGKGGSSDRFPLLGL